jgi:hypothetical protein
MNPIEVKMRSEELVPSRVAIDKALEDATEDVGHLRKLSKLRREIDALAAAKAKEKPDGMFESSSPPVGPV